MQQQALDGPLLSPFGELTFRIDDVGSDSLSHSFITDDSSRSPELGSFSPDSSYSGPRSGCSSALYASTHGRRAHSRKSSTRCSPKASPDISLIVDEEIVQFAELERQNRQRRLWLNRLALMLPKPVRPIAHSASSLTGFVTVVLFLLLLLTAYWTVSDDVLASRQRLHSVVLPDAINLHSLMKRADLGSILNRADGTLERRSQLPLQVLVPLGSEEPAASSDTNTEDDGNPTSTATSSSEAVLSDASNNSIASGTSSPSLPRKDEQSLVLSQRLRSQVPQEHFRDNLRPDGKYLTYGVSNEFTTQFMSHLNGIYLAILMQRTPVLPPFVPSAKMDRRAAGYLAFSDVFDLPRLQTAIRTEIEEWKHLKISAEQATPLLAPANPQFADDKLRARLSAAVKKDNIVCWSLWQSQSPELNKPAGSGVQNHLGLNIEYWPVPPSLAHLPTDRHIRFWDLVLLDTDVDKVKTAHIAKVASGTGHGTGHDNDAGSPMQGALRLPDEQMLCYDSLFYTAATGPQEWRQPHAPVWNAVGQHVRWHPEVDRIVDEYLAKTLKGTKTGNISGFVTVHFRRRENSKQRSGEAESECLRSIDAYKQAVQRVRNELLEKRGQYARTVIVTTDETDAVVLAKLSKLGWLLVDHTRLQTVEKYHNPWWPIVLDSAILSRGSAFVGIEKSTMSMLAAKRVATWNDGPVELVK